MEAARPVGALPEASISVVTLAELHLGVLLAKDGEARSLRLRTLSRVERDFDPMQIDAEVARIFASIVAESRRRGRRPDVMDTWIAATAVRHGLVVFSQDAGFQKIPQVEVRLI